MGQIATALVQYGLPTLLLAIVSWAFWVFLQRRDAEYKAAMTRHEKIVATKDKEIARLNEARMAEQQQARAELAQVARGALEMSQALADYTETNSQ